ncbi:MAG TPA: SDR family NAD(P)-dependent oxidoreductase, partial [Ramlibacter sp.]|nr:SDR family NAD(P)-dependent oxidoreductase [Ramlibacter sp.]
MAKPTARKIPRDVASNATGEQQRELQREQDRQDESRQQAGDRAARRLDKGGKAVQAGVREQPGPPMPRQHLEKPGLEAEMALKPRFEAPDYLGSGKLKGMVALITGGDSGIGRAVAVLFAREGADVAIVYLTSHEDAQETKRHVENEGRECLLVAGDVKDSKFCQEAVEKTVAEFD